VTVFMMWFVSSLYNIRYRYQLLLGSGRLGGDGSFLMVDDVVPFIRKEHQYCY